jgi:hypothetical protein
MPRISLLAKHRPAPRCPLACSLQPVEASALNDGLQGLDRAPLPLGRPARGLTPMTETARLIRRRLRNVFRYFAHPSPTRSEKGSTPGSRRSRRWPVAPGTAEQFKTASYFHCRARSLLGYPRNSRMNPLRRQEDRMRMQLMTLLLFSGGLFLVSSGLAQAQEVAASREPLASVSGQPVYEKDLLPLIQGQLRQLQQQEYQVKRKALDELINQKSSRRTRKRRASRRRSCSRRRWTPRSRNPRTVRWRAITWRSSRG